MAQPTTAINENWTPAPFVVFVEGNESGNPFRFRVGGYRSFEDAIIGAKENERAVTGTDPSLRGLIDLRATGTRTYRIFECAGWTERAPDSAIAKASA